MSEENVAIAREAYGRFVEGDPTWTDWLHPNIAWDFSAYPLADLPTHGRGSEELLREVIETYFSGWVDYRAEILETIDAGDDVIVVIHEVARMRGSDAVLERDVAHIWTIRERKWVLWRIFSSRAAALEAAGLRA